MNENFFDVSKIKVIDLKELHNKNLKMIVSTTENKIMICGQDQETNEIFVISIQDKIQGRMK